VKAKSYVLPSDRVVHEYILGSSERNAVLLVGGGTVSERWGKYYGVKLRDYFKNVEVLFAEAVNAGYPTDGQTIIAVGNAENNPFISRFWPTSLPKELTYFPLIYLQQEEDGDLLFIVGSDQNIFFTQRTFEGMGLKRLRPEDFLVFIIMALGLIAMVSRSSKLKWNFPILVAVGIVFILLEVRRISEAYLTWDSLYVYFDGALSLSFLGDYETIMTGRSSPGTSYLTYLYFLLTSPIDVNAFLLTLLMSLTVLLLGYATGTKLLNRWNGFVIMVILYTNPYFRDRIPIYSSEMPFAAITLIALAALSAQSRRGVASGGFLIALSSAIRPSGLLLYPSAVALMLRRRRLHETATLTTATVISMIVLQLFAPTMGVIEAYSTEIFVKEQDAFNPLKLYQDARDVLRYFILTLGVALVPGFLIMRNMGRFLEISSLYVLFHLLGIVLWVGVSSRYVFPVIPIATIITITSLNGLKSPLIRWSLLVMAIGINLYMTITGYRFQGVV
jgi:preprotein translocase subunit SecG